MFDKIKSAHSFLEKNKKELMVKYSVLSYPNYYDDIIDEVFTRFTGDIYLKNLYDELNQSNESEEDLIGRMNFIRLDFTKVQILHPEDLFFIFDSDTFFARLYDRLYDSENEQWLIEEMNFCNTFWLMQDVYLKHTYRGKGFIQLLLMDKLNRFINSGDLIFSFAFPLQFDKTYRDNKFISTPGNLSFDDCQNKLYDSYKNVGYNYLEEIKTKEKKLKLRVKNEKKEDNKLIFFFNI